MIKDDLTDEELESYADMMECQEVDRYQDA